MPYLEQQNLYEELGVETTTPRLDRTFLTAERIALARTPLEIFRCPSDTGPALNPLRSRLSTSNYRAVSGPKPFPSYAANEDMGGVMYQNSKISLSHIPDGASNTFCVGECMLDEPSKKRAALWVWMRGVHPVTHAIWLSDVMWCVDDESATINGPAPQAFSSRHPRGAFFLFCDGSVRFASDRIEPSMMKALAGRDDGVNVGDAALD